MRKQQNINNKEISEQVKEILDACSRRVKDSKSESIKVFKKYFNKDNPIFDINKPLPGQGTWNALAFATYFGKTDEVKALLELGADPKIELDKKINVLHIAATEGRETMCLYYLKSGVDIDSQCVDGKTALIRACEAGHMNVVSVLIQFNPDVMLKDKRSKTCLDYALESKSYDIVRFIEHYYLQNKIPLKGKEAKKTVKV